MRAFCGQFGKELTPFFEEIEEKPFRLKQVFDWVYQKGILTYDGMRNLPLSLREKLSEALPLGILKIVSSEDSGDGETKKFLWKLHDGKLVESVLISSGERRTVCVSSQVGCPARCAFCASGKQGLIRHLSAAEIVEQVVHINHQLAQKGERVTHLVFMGMGEPLDNYEEVVRALKILIDPQLMNFSPRKITVSTVGVIENIEKLMHEGIKVNLAFSLHGPNQQIRKKIVPYARKYELSAVMKSVRDYARFTHRDLTYEYVLLEGINDSPHHAEELATLVKKDPCIINLIPYNPVEGLRLKRPKRDAIEAFEKILIDRGVRCTRRYTKGKDIAAACGQLALKRVSPN